MKILCLLFFLPISSMASGLSALTTVASLPGFSFKDDGTIVTDWNKSGDGRLGFDGRTKYSINDRNFLNVLYSRSSRFPTDVLIKMDTPRKVSVYSSIDYGGELGSVIRCVDSVCITATPRYCNRIYNTFKVKNGEELGHKLTQCIFLNKIDQDKSEVEELDRVKNRAREKGFEIAEKKESKGKHDPLEIPNDLAGKLYALSQLCQVVHPNFVHLNSYNSAQNTSTKNTKIDSVNKVKTEK